MNRSISNTTSFSTQIKSIGIKHTVKNYSDADLEVALCSSMFYQNIERQVEIEAEIARRVK